MSTRKVILKIHPVMIILSLFFHTILLSIILLFAYSILREVNIYTIMTSLVFISVSSLSIFCLYRDFKSIFIGKMNLIAVENDFIILGSVEPLRVKISDIRQIRRTIKRGHRSKTYNLEVYLNNTNHYVVHHFTYYFHDTKRLKEIFKELEIPFKLR